MQADNFLNPVWKVLLSITKAGCVKLSFYSVSGSPFVWNVNDPPRSPPEVWKADCTSVTFCVASSNGSRPQVDIAVDTRITSQIFVNCLFVTQNILFSTENSLVRCGLASRAVTRNPSSMPQFVVPRYCTALTSALLVNCHCLSIKELGPRKQLFSYPVL